MKCDLCKREVELGFTCNYCDQHFCDDHRLPEQHRCPDFPSRDWHAKRKTTSTRRTYRETRKPLRQRIIKRKTNSRRDFVVVLLVIIALGCYVQYSIVSGLDNFPTRDVLISFLKNDSTDSLVWSGDFTCEDFTETLIKNAEKEGYLLVEVNLFSSDLEDYRELVMKYGYDMGEVPDGAGHALCKAFIIDENRWVMVEPQADLILGPVG